MKTYPPQSKKMSMKHSSFLTIVFILVAVSLFRSVPATAQIYFPPPPVNVYTPGPSNGPTYVDPNKNPNKITIPSVQKSTKAKTGVTTSPEIVKITTTQEKIDCSVCNKSGKCNTCHGKGVNYHGSRWNKCGACDGTGNCGTCGGKGWHY